MKKKASFGAIIIGDEILSGKRHDKHFDTVIRLLNDRGMVLNWSIYLPDDPELITTVLSSTMKTRDVVFCFGGIGATPDDHTRQSAAKAAGVELAVHPEARREIESVFGDDAYPKRIQMGVFPVGCTIIPNPYNRIPGFSMGSIHFFPGFPVMAWPMLEWVLDSEYRKYYDRNPSVDLAIIITNVGESQLIDLMNECLGKFPSCKVFSLPTIVGSKRKIELGVKGKKGDALKAINFLRDGVSALGFEWIDR